MGWCSATPIFDAVCRALFDKPKRKSDREEILMMVIGELEEGDWDCQQDSAYWEHPEVQKIFRDIHPRWFEDE